MKKRWLSLYVENNSGVLAMIAGLFAGKAYNLESLTVGTTEDTSVSRMTISLLGDDATFEQIKKQLNRCVDVIKVIDMTKSGIYSRELLFIKVIVAGEKEIKDVFRMADVYQLKVVEYDGNEVLLECVNRDKRNDVIIDKFRKFKHIEVVRGGSVAIEP